MGVAKLVGGAIHLVEENGKRVFTLVEGQTHEARVLTGAKYVGATPRKNYVYPQSLKVHLSMSY